MGAQEWLLAGYGSSTQSCPLRWVWLPGPSLRHPGHGTMPGWQRSLCRRHCFEVLAQPGHLKIENGQQSWDLPGPSMAMDEGDTGQGKRPTGSKEPLCHGLHLLPSA